MQFEFQLPPDLPRRAAGVGALALVAAALYWWLSAPVASAPISVTTQSAPSSSTAIVVHVIGNVRRPGVVELPQGARVMDAVEAAGGVLPRTVVTENLARVVVDGEQINIGRANTPVAAADGRISINSSSAAQIEQLPGVGPVLAQRIVEYRDAHGSFAQLRDLLNVPGIGDAKYAQLAEMATL